jgi:hypothetical protein
MNARLVEQPLDSWAVEYVQQRLLHGNALAAAALEVLPLEKGTVTTCLPQGTVLKRLEDFRTGGKLPTPPSSEWSSTERNDEILLMIPIPNTDDWLAAKVGEFLAEAEEHVCVFEDPLARVGDPVLRNMDTRYATFGGEIYHLILTSDSDQAYIRKVLKRAKGIPTFIGVFTESRTNLAEKRPLNFSTRDIQALAAQAKKLVVGAFDGESYLIWDRGRA